MGETDREWWKDGEWVMNRLPVSLIKHSLVEFAWCFRTAKVMSGGSWSTEVLDCDVDHFWQYQSTFAFQPFPFSAYFSLLRQSYGLQRAFDSEHFDSAGCKSWAKQQSILWWNFEGSVHSTSNPKGFAGLLSWHRVKNTTALEHHLQSWPLCI